MCVLDMIKENQKIEIKWGSRNKNYYINKGYVFTKMGDKFLVEAQDVMPTSAIKVICVCDYCGEEFTRRMNCREQAIDQEYGELCYHCAHDVRAKAKSRAKHGVENINQLSERREFFRKIGKNQSYETQEKRKNTCLQRYGVPYYIQSEDAKIKRENAIWHRYGVHNASQSIEVQQKRQNTVMDRYDVSHIWKSPVIQSKIRQTLREKYGVDNVSQIPEVQKKKEQTCYRNYGVLYPMQNIDILSKARKTLVYNGTIPSSKPERKLVDILQNLYGVDRCIPSFVYQQLVFDCLLVLDHVKIDIEYDGWYWHKNKIDYDRRRNYWVISRGFKVLRIISNTTLPTMQELITTITTLQYSADKIAWINLISNNNK